MESNDDKPMNINYSDEQFCKDCGIKCPELWEWYEAKYGITEDEK